MINLDIEKFKNWLVQNGAEILPPTNEYEVLRFKGTEVGVIYSTGKTSGRYANIVINTYKKKERALFIMPKSTKRKGNYLKEKKYLLKRDGDLCFYCSEKLGDDITVEHIQSLSSGGKNTLGNMVLAHYKCNEKARCDTVTQKVNMALNARLSKFINMKNSKESQTKQILNYLQQGNKLTQLEALRLFGCFRLASRVSDIKRQGIDVKGNMIEAGKKRVKQYYL